MLVLGTHLGAFSAAEHILITREKGVRNVVFNIF